MSYATPFGYQTNLLLLTAGGYKFTDFLRAGVPLTVIMWLGFSIVGGSGRVYFGGDTGYFSGFAVIGQGLGPFDLAALPIGAYEPSAMMRESHLDPEQAVQAALDLHARRMLGIHFGTFDLSDEPLDEPPARFRTEAEARGHAPEDAWILEVGETRRF